jgi:transposase
VVAATVLGFVGEIDRFSSRDHFAAYAGTAPIEVSSGNRRIHRLSRRGNRQLNHAVHMAAVTQIRNPGTAGHTYYHRKLNEGMGRKAALRALKRKISDAIYTRLAADSRAMEKDPGGHTGNDSASSVTGSHPATPALRTSHSRATTKPTSTDRTPSAPATEPHRTSHRRTAWQQRGLDLCGRQRFAERTNEVFCAHPYAMSVLVRRQWFKDL